MSKNNINWTYQVSIGDQTRLWLSSFMQRFPELRAAAEKGGVELWRTISVLRSRCLAESDLRDELLLMNMMATLFGAVLCLEDWEKIAEDIRVGVGVRACEKEEMNDGV